MTLLVTAFGSTRTNTRVRAATIAPAQRLLPARPLPQVVATRGGLRIELPVAQSRVTALGYHATSTGALALDPIGSPANEGLLARVAHRLFGGSTGGVRYYRLGGSGGPDTGVLDVGASPGTDVYSPVDGTIVGIADNIVSGRKHGVRLDIQPADAPALVVSVTHLRPIRRWRSARRSSRPSRRSGPCSTCLGSRRRRSRDTPRTRATTWRSRCTRRPRSQLPEAPPRRRRLRRAGPPRGRDSGCASLREELDVDFCVVNGENAADGSGLTPRLAERLLAAGADAITLGNHAWRRRELYAYRDVLANAGAAGEHVAPRPGPRALTVVPARDGTPVAVINLMGKLFLDIAVGPFEIVDELVEEARAATPVVIVDFHAEATSEKVGDGALARRARHRRRRHAHARPDDRRPRAPRRHRDDRRRGHDRPARLGHRRQGGARDRAHAHWDCRSASSRPTAAFAWRACSSTAARDGRATSCRAIREEL